MDDSVTMLVCEIVSGYIIISDQISIESTGDGEIFSGYLNVAMRCSNFQLHSLLDFHLRTKPEFCLKGTQLGTHQRQPLCSVTVTVVSDAQL